jgi:Protein of unknown function (DUF2892)
MTSWQATRVIAGSFVIASIALALPVSPFYISQNFIFFTIFVGINLLQSGITRWCLMEILMRKVGFKSE